MKNIILLVLMFIVCDLAFGQFTDLQEAKLNLMNLYSNPGAEAQLDGWSETGGGTLTTDTSTKRSGKAAIKFTSSATSDYLNFPVVVVKKGTNNCEASFYYKTTSSVFDAEIYINSVRVAILDLNAVTEFTKAIVTFVCTDFVNSTQGKITNGANTDIIYVDDSYIGDNLNIGSVNLQDKEYDITTQVTGDNAWSTTYASARVKKDRSATAMWRVEGNIRGTSNNVGGGTTVNVTIAGLTTKNTSNFVQSCVVSDAANLTTGRCRIDPNSGILQLDNASATTTRYVQFSFLLESKPTWATDYAAEQVVRAENANGFGYAKWYNIANCVFTTSAGTYTTLTDGDCNSATESFGVTSGNDNLEITKTNLKANTYYKLTANGSFYNQYATSAGRCDFQITDGTTEIASTHQTVDSAVDTSIAPSFSGYIKYDSVQATKTFSVKAKKSIGGGSCNCDSSSSTGPYSCSLSIEEVYPTQAMSQIVNSVGTTHNGITRLESVHFSDIDSYSTRCDDATCTLSNNTGGISSISRVGSGQYTLNFVAGTFTQKPSCVCTGDLNASFPFCTINGCTISSCNIYTVNGSFTQGDSLGNIICHGIK